MIKQLFKNLMWLCKTDLQKEWENRNTITITAKDMERSARMSRSMRLERGEAVIPANKLEAFVTTDKSADAEYWQRINRAKRNS